MFTKSVKVVAAALTLALAATGPANAGSTSTTFQVTATVASSCTIVSVGTLAFGTYTPSGAATSSTPGGNSVSSTSTLTYYCTNGTTPSVALNAGSSGGTFAQRLMSDGSTHTLQYNLYVDSAHTSIWGDGTGGSTKPNATTGTGIGTSYQQTMTIYGLLPDSLTNQSAYAANYTDTITLTMNF